MNERVMNIETGKFADSSLKILVIDVPFSIQSSFPSLFIISVLCSIRE